MEQQLNLRFLAQAVLVLFLTSVLNVSTKENDKFGASSKSEVNSGSKGDKMNVLSKDIGQPVHEPKTSTADLRQQDQQKSWRSSHYTSKDSFCEYDQRDIECSDTGGDCLKCELEEAVKSCNYGQNVTVACIAPEQVVCKGDKEFQKEIVCQYCYQTPLHHQVCDGYTSCNAAPRNFFRANCTVLPHVICFGKRRFSRNLPCNWKNGYRWSTAFILSVTLGGFGADRFYLGRWQEGIGKLFSFGGLGLWTIIDIILIGVRYLGPADGSMFVD